jgi:hypothetical protein
MKIIDEKGKLFGVINVFDLFVLVLIVATAFFAIKWARIADDPSWMKVKMMHVNCIGIVEIPDERAPYEGVPKYIADIIKEGDTSFNTEGVPVGVIEKVISNEPVKGPVYYSKDGEKLFFNNDSREVTVRLKLLAYEKKGDIYPCITKVPLRIGDGITMKTKKYYLLVSVRKILNDRE